MRARIAAAAKGSTADLVCPGGAQGGRQAGVGDDVALMWPLDGEAPKDGLPNSPDVAPPPTPTPPTPTPPPSPGPGPGTAPIPKPTPKPGDVEGGPPSGMEWGGVPGLCPWSATSFSHPLRRSFTMKRQLAVGPRSPPPPAAPPPPARGESGESKEDECRSV